MRKTILALSVAAGVALGVTLTDVSNSSALGYGQGKAVDGNNRPDGAVSFTENFCESDAYALTSDSNRIIITFDQGYENGYTEKILDTLKEKNVTAIFFLTGDYAKKEKPLINRMINEGHMLGNHGMKHAMLSELTNDAIRDEIMSLHDYVLDEYGYEMQYFRCPCGDYSETSLEAVKELGYKTLFWSYAYVDWITDSQPQPSVGFKKLTESAHGGEILLLHSVSSTNAEILGDVIDNFRTQGFTV